MPELSKLLQKIETVRIGVLGDFCLDGYWEEDFSAAEPSVETGLPTRPVRAQRYALGGAGNIVNNLKAMGVRSVEAFGVVGSDLFGCEMQRLLAERGAGQGGMLTQTEQWDTLVYLKPIREGREENRIDFGNFNRLSAKTAEALIDTLEKALPGLDFIIVNQQVARGIHTEYFQSALNRLLDRHPEKTFIVDSRHCAGAYRHCLRKLNEVEALKLCGVACTYGDVVAVAEAEAAARQLFERWRKPVFVSRGARGLLVADETGVRAVPGLHVIGPTDPVGAGDSLLAGLAAALAAGYPAGEAAEFGNFVAGVTVQKLFQTGTATPAEIRAIGAQPDYVYEPELADDARTARYRAGTEIEIIADRSGPIPTHAIFDHDGTISTLRQGWEAVMEPMMIRTILGEHYASAGETLYNRVVRRVRDYIDQTTGIQTLVQMQGLVKLVREFGQVPDDAVFDEHRYKAIYLQALMERVAARLRKLRTGELDASDFTLKGAPAFLDRLHRAGVRLYLASGTDLADVVAEAQALGYAPLFENRIYGANSDATQDAKRIVLDRILNEIGNDAMARVVMFGDGPVEIREARKRGALAVGVASDEVRRFGLNPAKRSRLIRAGAHWIVPDYSQGHRIWEALARPDAGADRAPSG